MANVVLFEPKQRPEYALAKQEASALTKSLAGGGGFPGKRISIKGGVFRLIVDGKQVAAIDERYMDVVIVRAADHIGRMYFSKKFEDDTPAAPDCWSADGTKPDATAANPQSAQCASCPQNVKGSGNDDSRACRFSQRVAVLLANDMEGDVMQLSLPATSLFGRENGDDRPLQAYARYLAANNANIEQFITRLKFDTTAATPKLFFKPMRWLVASEYAVTQAAGRTDEAVKAVTMSVSQTTAAPVPALPAALGAPLQQKNKATDDGEAPPPPPPAATPAAAPKKKRGRPSKKKEADEEPAAPEPTLRATPAAPVMPKREDVASIAAAWDD